MTLTQLRARIRSGRRVSRPRPIYDKLGKAIQLAFGKARQSSFGSKTHDRSTETKREYEAAANQLYRTGDRQHRRDALDVRQFI